MSTISKTYKIENIRNFAIIAHIDHGKSTLSNKIIEICNNEIYEMDDMELEKEKGITIKSKARRLSYRYKGEEYVLNLVDTPGHVDFQYEVQKSLYTVNVVILLIDATKGIESQTLSNYYLAKEMTNLKIIIVINKIDSVNSDIEMCKKQIINILGIDIEATKIFYISGKDGQGVKELVEEGIINTNVHPKGLNSNPLQTLIFDSWYDNYLGIILLIYVAEGRISKKDILVTISNNIKIEALKFGYMEKTMTEVDILNSGEVGYLVTGIKEPNILKIGDTLIHRNQPKTPPLPGFKNIKPVVFCSLYPERQDQYLDAKKNLEKLNLNDSSFSFEAEKSDVFGMGFRAGFLGLLHMEIILERLSREYNIQFIVTVPNVIYRLKVKGEKDAKYISNASDFPTPDKIEVIEEQIVLVTIVTIQQYIGAVKELCLAKRGMYDEENFLDERVVLVFRIPLGEIILDFQDTLKSITSGYASYTYEFLNFEPASLVKLDFLINGQNVSELSCIVHKTKAEEIARARCTKLKENIPRGQVEIRIQAALNGKVIASERIAPYLKDVTAKCYGGDITRKNKLWDKQKEGKKRMAASSSKNRLNIPPQAFMKIIRIK